MDAPWSGEKTLGTKDSLERLSKEILDFEKYIQPTKEEKFMRDSLQEQVSNVIKTLLPDCKITAFGSSVTGLALPGSDVDINVNIKCMEKQSNIANLRAICKETIEQKIFQGAKTRVISKAKVPVLMAVAKNNMPMDITFQKQIYSTDRTLNWLDEFPHLKPLFMVLKQAIGNFRLTDLPEFKPLSTKVKGLASYSLLCLIVHYLQLSVPDHVKPENPNYLGSVLLGFLSFYSDFDPNINAIGLVNGGCFYDVSNCPIIIDYYKGRKITIVDPDQRGFNISRSTRRFDRVQIVFEKAFQMLTDKINKSHPYESILSSVIKVDHHLHTQARQQGIQFNSIFIWIDTGLPIVKSRKRSRSTNDEEVPNKQRKVGDHQIEENDDIQCSEEDKNENENLVTNFLEKFTEYLNSFRPRKD